MRISELSERTGVPIPTIKFYLRQGLLSRGKPTARNQAEYSEDHIRRLRLIRALAEVGRLPLTSVRDVLGAIDDERVPLHEMLGVAHYALGPVPEKDDGSADLHRTLTEVNGFLASRGWKVDPGSPARRALAQALLTLRRMGRDSQIEEFLPYADAADRLARREVRSIDPRQPRGQVVEDIVLGTVVFEAALVALRRLAQEHYAAGRFAQGRTQPKVGTGPKSRRS